MTVNGTTVKALEYFERFLGVAAREEPTRATRYPWRADEEDEGR